MDATITAQRPQVNEARYERLRHPISIEKTAPVCVTGFARVLYLSLAAVFCGIGVLGIVLPGLPATPFLLLTAYFLARSSPKLHAALLRSPYTGPILRHWQQHRGVTPRTKLQATCVIAVSIGLTCSLSTSSLIVRTITIFMAAVGLVVIWRLPTAMTKAVERPVLCGALPPPHGEIRHGCPTNRDVDKWALIACGNESQSLSSRGA